MIDVAYRRRKRSTGFHRAKYVEFYDLSSSSTSPTRLRISAGGLQLKNRLAPLFGIFRYYRIRKTVVQLIPAAQLPADPGHISITPGQNTTDPRDLLNLGVFRYNSGEGTNRIPTFADIASAQLWYNHAQTDPTFGKFSLQSGRKWVMTPRSWQIAANTQDGDVIHRVPVSRSTATNGPNPSRIASLVYGYATGGTTDLAIRSSLDTTADIRDDYGLRGGIENYESSSWVGSPGIYPTGHRVRFGWLPTSQIQAFGGILNRLRLETARVPQVMLLDILLPQAYLTVFHFRLWITHYVDFSGIVNFDQNYMSLGGYPYDTNKAALLGPNDWVPYVPNMRWLSSVGDQPVPPSSSMGGEEDSSSD